MKNTQYGNSDKNATEKCDFNNTNVIGMQQLKIAPVEACELLVRETSQHREDACR